MITNLQYPSNQFVQVLIDGDDFPFLHALVQQGKIGGDEAACKLREEVEAYMEAIYPGLELRVMVNMYVSLAGQARLFEDHDISREDLDQFIREFNAFAHLDIIDVGRGKERADHKLGRMFDFCLTNRQCKHIIVGGLHDIGYVNMLREAKSGKDKDRITLLQTTAVQAGFEKLGFEIITFRSVFKAQGLGATNSTSYSPSSSPSSSPMQGKARPSSGKSSPSAPKPARLLQENMTPSLASSTLGSSASLATKTPVPSGKTSYASMAAGDGSRLNTPFDIAPSKRKPSILVNTANERLDNKLGTLTPTTKLRCLTLSQIYATSITLMGIVISSIT